MYIYSIEVKNLNPHTLYLNEKISIKKNKRQVKIIWVGLLGGLHFI